MDSNFLEHAVRSSLVDLLEKPVLCVLRDGKKIFGTLICFDQFCNVVLKDALRREIVEKKFSDIDIGLFIVRGENVALIGELDLDFLDQQMREFEHISVDEISALQAEEGTGTMRPIDTFQF